MAREAIPKIVEAISQTRAVAELEAVLAQVCQDLGYAEAAYYRLARLGSPVQPTLALGGAFEAFISVYIEQHYAAVDPVVPLAFRRDLPFTVREVEADFPEPANLHADRRRLWAPDGLFCPVATSWGEVGVVGWASSRTVELAPADRLAMGMISRVFVTQLKQLSSGAVMPDLPLRPLSRREGECAFWAAEGKNAQEIADILGLSVHTVRQYLDSAILKLDAKNRGEMLLRGAALGLISDRGSA